jgi:hypothetical protein
MMGVGVVLVNVGQGRVRVLVRVSSPLRVRGGVLVSMMGVMLVFVGVHERFMSVPVLVVLGKMQPHSRGHQEAADEQLRRQRLAE